MTVAVSERLRRFIMHVVDHKETPTFSYWYTEGDEIDWAVVGEGQIPAEIRERFLAAKCMADVKEIFMEPVKACGSDEYDSRHEIWAELMEEFIDFPEGL